MLELELLWKLQCIDRELLKAKRNRENKEGHVQLNNIKSEYNMLKEEFLKESAELEANEKSVLRLNNDLKNLDFKAKEGSRRLYEEGSDIKVIENLQKEVEACRVKIDDIENKLLKIMDINDGLRQKIDYKGSRMKELKKEFESLKAEYIVKNDNSKKEQEMLENRRKGIESEIDGELIMLYNDIALKKLNPVSEVKNGICTECGVKLNSMLYDAVRKKNTINKCDNCGRILYLE